METKTFTRQQLYELVWQRPLRDVARELGISDVGLGKACRRLAIPLPGRGYWAKVAARQNLTPIPLPKLPNLPSQISFASVEPPPPREARPPVPPQKQQHVVAPLVLSTLQAPHPLVKELQRGLRKQDIDSHGLRSVNTPQGFSITVSPASQERALAILDTLLLRLKTAGARVLERPSERYRDEPRRYLSLDGEEVHISLREPYRQQRKTELELEEERRAGARWPTKYRYFPSGRLTLCINNYPRLHEAAWSDGKTPLEEFLPDILSALLALPDALKEQRRKDHEAELARLEEERRRADAKRQQERRQQCLADLLSEAQRWQQHASLIAYLDELEERASQHPEADTESFRNGMAVARQLAACLLPFDQRITRLAKHGLVPNKEIEQPWLSAYY